MSKSAAPLSCIQPVRGPSHLCIELLRDLLLKAEAGYLVSVAAAYENSDGTSNYQIARQKWSSWIVMVGELERAKMGALKFCEQAQQDD
jgi:hypothetical protein